MAKNEVLLKETGNYSPVIIKDNEVKILEILGNDVSFSNRLITDREQLLWTLGVLKKEGLRIVYTSGVYDMIHEGHLKYLEAAKKHGDVLVVGVDSDELTRERKPDLKNRPIVPLKDRLFVLANVRSVNILTVRNVGDHPVQMVADIKPDFAVFSKSTKDIEQSKLQDDIGRFCGEIIFLDPQAETSTTGRIRSLMEEGATGLGEAVQETVENYLKNGGGHGK